MANILYGINGEGSGHWTRSKEVITHLQDSGHKVIVVTSDRALFNLKRDFKVEEIYGLGFKYVKGRVSELRSFIKNANAIPRGAISLRRVNKIIKRKSINLIITDFEPISSLASNIKHIPAISIDNQHFITNTDAGYPSKYRIQADITKAGIEIMTFGVESYIVISFFEAKPKNKKTLILPPILRRQVFDLKPSDGDYILVYLTYRPENLNDILKSVPYKFIFYGADQESRDANITFKKFDSEKFIIDLAGAGGVLATAGFSLISEALYLHKPYLAWPVKNQFEQLFNAYHIDRLGYGKFSKNLTAEDLDAFVSSLGSYRKNLASYPNEDNSRLFAKLDQLIKQHVG